MPIPLTYDSAIEKHLRPGERILWVGQPRQGWAYRWHNRLLFVQAGWAIMTVWWLFKVTVTTALRVGIDLGIYPGRPTGIMTTLVLVGAVVTIWQLITDKRRREGTWYAVTDRRLLFVLTTVWPESAIDVEYDDIAEVRIDQRDDVPAPARDCITIRLRSIDPYVANSTVLSYLVSANTIVLENVQDAHEMCQLILQQVRTHNGGDVPGS